MRARFCPRRLEMSWRGRTRFGVHAHSIAAPRMFIALLARCFGTYSNYLGHLRTICYAAGFEAPPIGHPCLRRAMTAIAKRQMFQQRERKHIQKYARFPTSSRSLVLHSFACLAGIWSPTWCWRRPKDKRSSRSACSGWCPMYSFCVCPQRCGSGAQGGATACVLSGLPCARPCR